MRLYGLANPANLCQNGVKLNFNSFRALLALRLSIEELRVILEDGAFRGSTYKSEGIRDFLVPVTQSDRQLSEQNFARVVR